MAYDNGFQDGVLIDQSILIWIKDSPKPKPSAAMLHYHEEQNKDKTDSNFLELIKMILKVSLNDF